MAYYDQYVAEETTDKLTRVVHILLYFAIMTSGYVLFEPAPFDLLILLTIFLYMFTSITLPSQLKWVLSICFIHLAASFTGVLMSTHYADSYMHIVITSYMMIFAFGLIILIYNDPHKMLDIIMKAYVWAALISTILAIMGYFHIGPTYDLFTLYGRAKGGFKDPNVYGPFIIPPMIYLVERIVTSKLKFKILPMLMFSVLLLGLLLSFSRGAWGGFLFATFILFASMYYTSRTNRFRVELSLYILIAIIFLILALILALNIPSISQLLTERAAITQSYDTAEGGRFTHHWDALVILTDHPWGIGAKEFTYDHLEDVHNTYLTLFMIGGWVGGFSYLLIIITTLVSGFKYCFMDFALRKQFVVFYATFVALSIEAYIIDIDHWRVLYIMTGAIWGVIFHQKYNPNATPAYS